LESGVVIESKEGDHRLWFVVDELDALETIEGVRLIHRARHRLNGLSDGRRLAIQPCGGDY
jgi:hypothetical protein